MELNPHYQKKLKMEVFWKIIKEVIPEFNNKKEQPKM
jgi:hypothetical protein